MTTIIYDDDDADQKQDCHLLPMFAPVADATRQRGPVSVCVSIRVSGLVFMFINFFKLSVGSQLCTYLRVAI